jgi:hypothetical protein
MLKKAAVRMRRTGGRVDRVDAEILDKTRDEDRVLYARYVVVGWEGMEEPNGTPIPFTTENCMDFCNQCPSEYFDQIRNFASEPSNFAVDTEDVPEPSELAGN